MTFAPRIFPLAFVVCLISLPLVCHAQQDAIRSSPAYAEVLIRKTDVLADIEAFAADYTEANPRMVDLRFEAASLERAFEKILAVKPAEAGKLTLALGKLLVRRAAFETELDRLSRSYAKDHPDVKRAKRRVEIFDAAIKEVLK